MTSRPGGAASLHRAPLDRPTALALAVMGAMLFNHPGYRILAPVALCLLVWGRIGTRLADGDWRVPALGVVAGVAGASGTGRWLPLWAVSAGLAVVGAIWVVRARTARVDRRTAWIVVPTGAVLVLMAMPPTFLDVGLLHRAGGDALFGGASPWTGLAVPDASTTAAPGAVIDGYPYPPVTLFFFGGIDQLLGDFHLAGLLAWAVLAWSVWIGAPGREPAILLTAAGAMPLMVWTGWTEIFTLALVGLAAVAWSRPRAAGALLGLALASKQYLVVAVPLLVAGLRGSVDVARRWRWALCVAAMAAGIGLVWGSSYLEATIGLHGAQAARQEAFTLAGALNLFGVQVALPTWLGLAGGVAWAAWRAFGRRFDSDEFLPELAATLAVTFVLSPVAHGNYWFLAWAMLLVDAAHRSRRPA